MSKPNQKPDLKRRSGITAALGAVAGTSLAPVTARAQAREIKVAVCAPLSGPWRGSRRAPGSAP